MVRRLAVLVAAALLISAVLPGSLAAADPKGTKLSKEDHAQLAKAAAAGNKTITVLIAAKPGANSTVATGITGLGGKVLYREDQIDYIRASVPSGKVEAAAALKGVQALEVDAVIPLPDPRPGDGPTGDRSDAADAARAPRRPTTTPTCRSATPAPRSSWRPTRRGTAAA